MVELFRKHKSIILKATSAFLLICLLIATSYAYFTSAVNSNSKETVITTGILEIEFTDGPQVEIVNAIPGDKVVKTFKVKNTGTASVWYDVYLSEVINNFVDRSDLVFRLRSNDGGYNSTADIEAPLNPMKVIENYRLNVGKEHNYELEIEFLNKDENQDDNKNADFSTIVRVNEVKKATRPVTIHSTGTSLNDSEINLAVGEALEDLPEPEREGYNFEGWFLDERLTQRITDETLMTTNITNIYAKWDAIDYELSVSTQDDRYGSVNMTSSTQNFEDTVTLVATPSTGYVFSGWKDENDRIVSSDPTYTFSMPSNGVTLQATFTFDITTISNIKVLNVYPTTTQENVFKSWMDTYGDGKIEVTPVVIENFRENPSSYLGTSNNWNYHVVVFGFYDCNSSKDLSESSAELISKFIDEGHGVIFGHDTITAQGCGNHTYFNSLAPKVNLELSTREYRSSSRITIVKEGVFTSYPYQIGNEGTILTIPTTHDYGQVANGDIWLKLTDDSVTDNQNFYLTTYKNTAMIQTGHSNGNATSDEQKILANIIFYLYSYDLME